MVCLIRSGKVGMIEITQTCPLIKVCRKVGWAPKGEFYELICLLKTIDITKSTLDEQGNANTAKVTSALLDMLKDEEAMKQSRKNYD